MIDRVNKRIEQMTNLDMDTAEELQIANYGIGGHYDPHFDFARVSCLCPVLNFKSVLDCAFNEKLFSNIKKHNLTLVKFTVECCDFFNDIVKS